MYKKLLTKVLFLSLLFSVLFTNIAYASSPTSSTDNTEVYIKTDSGKLASRGELALNYNPNIKYDRKVIDDFLEQVDKEREERRNELPVSASSDYGAAQPYISETSTSINCYGYAVGMDQWVNPGDIAYYYGSPIEQGETPDVNTVAKYVLDDLSRTYRKESRIISSATASINSDEYRIALRVGNQQGTYDYHFMKQCSDGGWCHKPSILPSEYLGNINPSTYSWDLYYFDGSLAISNFYDSSTIYIAVKK
jgi:hypothetical protein